MKEIKCKECKHGWCSIHGKRFCTRVHDFKDEDDTCEKAEKKEEESRDE